MGLPLIELLVRILLLVRIVLYQKTLDDVKRKLLLVIRQVRLLIVF
jgi:hypothetical protein